MCWKKIAKKIQSLKEGISFAIMETKWKDYSKYGLISDSVMFKKPMVISNPKEVYFHPYSRIQSHARIINYTGKFILKSYAVCSDNLTVVTGNHTPTVGVPEYYLGMYHFNDKETDIIVEEGAWIGINVTLIPGAKVGRGAVIGACSLVNKEIPPYAVAVGSPAKIIATTFTLDQVLEHERKVFPKEERLSEEYLRNLFDTQYKGLKAIGTNVISPSDSEDAQRVAKIISEFNEKG